MSNRPQRRFWKVQASYYEPVEAEPDRLAFVAGEAHVLPLDSTRAKALDAATNAYAAVKFAVENPTGLVVSITARDEYSRTWAEMGQYRQPEGGGTPYVVWAETAAA